MVHVGGRKAAEAAAATPSEASWAEGERRSAERDTRDTDGAAPATGQPLTEGAALRMSCAYGIHYHDDRERFFGRMHRCFMFAVIVMGAGAAADVTAALGWFDAKWLGAAAALIGAADIAFDVSGRARLHAGLKRDAVAILERIESGCGMADARAAIARSHADEPPIMHGVAAWAYHAAQRGAGRPDATCLDVRPWQRALRHWLAFTPESFPDKANSE